MKTSLKRLICAVFCLCILIASFSACGGGKGGDTASKGGSTGGGDFDIDFDSDFDPYANIPDSIKGQTVRFATWEQKDLEAYDFNKFYTDTGIKAEVYHVPQPGYVSTLQTKIAAGDIPDVFLDNDGTGFPTTLSIAQPINKCSNVDLSNDPLWDQSMLATATIDGDVFMVNTLYSPWSGSNIIYYNKALFDELGEKTPTEYYEDGEWTWDTLEQMLKRFKSAGYVGGNINQIMLAGSAGASYITYDYKNQRFINNVDSVELLAAYETFASWQTQGLLGATMQMFKEGKAAVYALGVYGLKKTGHWSDMDPEDVGFIYFPSMKDGGTAYTPSNYRMYGIIAGAPHANAAGYFIRHYLDYRNYDLDDMFMSEEAGDFYYEVTNKNADQKYFAFDDHCASLVGIPEYTLNKGATNASPSEVATEIQAVSNQVDKAVAAANKIIEKAKNDY